MYGSHSSIISRKEIKKFSQKRSAFVVQKAICLVITITIFIIIKCSQNRKLLSFRRPSSCLVTLLLSRSQISWSLNIDHQYFDHWPSKTCEFWSPGDLPHPWNCTRLAAHWLGYHGLGSPGDFTKNPLNPNRSPSNRNHSGSLCSLLEWGVHVLCRYPWDYKLS